MDKSRKDRSAPSSGGCGVDNAVPSSANGPDGPRSAELLQRRLASRRRSVCWRKRSDRRLGAGIIEQREKMGGLQPDGFAGITEPAAKQGEELLLLASVFVRIPVLGHGEHSEASRACASRLFRRGISRDRRRRSTRAPSGSEAGERFAWPGEASGGIRRPALRPAGSARRRRNTRF